MRRLALTLILLGALAVPTAASAASKPLRVNLTACRHGVNAVDRYLQTTSTVRLVPRSVRVVLRYELFWRQAGKSGFSRYPSPPFERRFRKASQHVYTVGSLPARAAYRLHVRARWFAKGGRIVRTDHRITRTCFQPDVRPDLTVVRFVWIGKQRFAAVIRNVGLTAAGPFAVDTTPFGGLGAGRSVRVFVGACATVTVDPDDRVHEHDETNNSRTAPCPPG